MLQSLKLWGSCCRSDSFPSPPLPAELCCRCSQPASERWPTRSAAPLVWSTPSVPAPPSCCSQPPCCCCCCAFTATLATEGYIRNCFRPIIFITILNIIYFSGVISFGTFSKWSIYIVKITQGHYFCEWMWAWEAHNSGNIQWKRETNQTL